MILPRRSILAMGLLAILPDPGSAADPTATLPRGQWIDLLARLPKVPRGAIGPWRKAEGELVVAAAQRPSRLPLGLVPGDAYDLAIEFTRDAEGTVGAILPIGSRSCLAALGLEGGASGIDTIDGRRGHANDSSVPGALANGRRYRLEINVRRDGDEASITMTLDDRPWGFYRGPAAALALHKDWALPRRNVLALAAQAGGTFHKVRFRPLTASARLE